MLHQSVIDCVKKKRSNILINKMLILIFSAQRNIQIGDKNKLGDLVIYPLDLSSLNSVKRCAKKLLMNEPAIHLLINNAGIMFTPYNITEDGFEIQLQSNYLGHFLLTLLLLPKIQSSGPNCRIVNVSSLAHICT